MKIRVIQNNFISIVCVCLPIAHIIFIDTTEIAERGTMVGFKLPSINIILFDDFEWNANNNHHYHNANRTKEFFPRLKGNINSNEILSNYFPIFLFWLFIVPRASGVHVIHHFSIRYNYWVYLFNHCHAITSTYFLFWYQF